MFDVSDGDDDDWYWKKYYGYGGGHPEAKSPGCQHKYVEYLGFTEHYAFCEHCNKKITMEEFLRL